MNASEKNACCYQRRLEQQCSMALTSPEEEGRHSSLSTVQSQSQRSSMEAKTDLQDARSKVEQALAKLNLASGGACSPRP